MLLARRRPREELPVPARPALLARRRAATHVRARQYRQCGRRTAPRCAPRRARGGNNAGREPAADLGDAGLGRDGDAPVPAGARTAREAVSVAHGADLHQAQSLARHEAGLSATAEPGDSTHHTRGRSVGDWSGSGESARDPSWTRRGRTGRARCSPSDCALLQAAGLPFACSRCIACRAPGGTGEDPAVERAAELARADDVVGLRVVPDERRRVTRGGRGRRLARNETNSGSRRCLSRHAPLKQCEHFRGFADAVTSH